jgi:hypothetical protein
MKRSLVVLLLSCFVVAGCAARSRAMASWVGNHYSNVIASWGPPDQVFDDGSGGRVFVWTRTRSYTTPGSATTQTNGSATIIGNTVWGDATSRTTYNPAETHQWKSYRMFWVDRNGRIYRWAWRGL